VKFVFVPAAIQLFKFKKKTKMKRPCTKVSSKNVMKALSKGKGTLSKGSKAKGALPKGSKAKGALAKGSKEESPKKNPPREILKRWVRLASKKGLRWQPKGLQLLKRLVKSSGIQ